MKRFVLFLLVTDLILIAFAVAVMAVQSFGRYVQAFQAEFVSSVPAVSPQPPSQDEHSAAVDSHPKGESPSPAPETPSAPEYSGETNKTNFTFELSFAGDCTLSNNLDQQWDGSFNWYAATQEPSYFLSQVYDIFSQDDFTVVNLECVLSDRELSPKDKGGERAFWFKGSSSHARILSAGSVEAVNLANNHTHDFGKEGIQDTIAAITEQGLLYGSQGKTLYLTKNGFNVAVICSGLWNAGQTAGIVKSLEEAQDKSDFQVVYFHGGEEGVHTPEEWKIQAARQLVDAGADLVIGNHPHVLQPMETYNGVTILYSIANFCYGGHSAPKNRTIILKLYLNIEDGVLTGHSVDAIPCYVYSAQWGNNYQPAPITDMEKKQRVLDFLSWRRDTPY